VIFGASGFCTGTVIFSLPQFGLRGGSFI